jgi:hypothetical protein
MADTKAKASADAGQAELQKQQDEAEAKGFRGSRPEGAIPNKEYTLQSGPTSPTPLEEHIVFNEQRTRAMKASPAEEAK